MNKKIIFVISIISVILVGTYFVFKYSGSSKIESKKIKVVTTLFPLSDIAKSIGGERASVYQLLPPGVEAHSFEPKPSDIVKINEADIFIYTGKFMEPWVDDILRSVNNKKLIIVDASKNTRMIPGVFHDADEPAGTLDPHIWLDFDNAKIMVENIEQAFINNDPSGASFFNKKGTDYRAELESLDKQYRLSLTSCEKKEIVYGGHYAFGYLANRYGLKYLATQGVSPDSEPTAKDMVDLVNQVNKEKIEYIFYEELSSPKIAETISRETKAKMLLLNAAHNLSKDNLESGISFFDILKSNLENLKTGLICK